MHPQLVQAALARMDRLLAAGDHATVAFWTRQFLESGAVDLQNHEYQQLRRLRDLARRPNPSGEQHDPA